MTNPKTKQKVRFVENKDEIDPLANFESLPKLRAHGYVIMPTPHASDLESIIWVSPKNFMAMRRALGSSKDK